MPPQVPARDFKPRSTRTADLAFYTQGYRLDLDLIAKNPVIGGRRVNFSNAGVKAARAKHTAELRTHIRDTLPDHTRPPNSVLAAAARGI
jgi:hypothetical protein